jgi:membrane-associated phospholipid phosphatase
MTDFEIKIINAVRSVITPFVDKLLELVTVFGEQMILILILLIVYFIFSKKAAQKMAFAVFTSLLLNNAIKGVVQRVRPFNHPNHTFDASRMETATGYSFPSGHTQNAAVCYTSLGIFLKKRSLWIIISVLIFLIALSRVGLGVHYPSDVIVGATLGVGCAFFGAWLFTKFENNFPKQMLVYLVVALVFLPFVFIFWRSKWEDIVIYKDFYTAYSFYLGYVGAVYLEHKFVNFNCDNPLKTRIIRTAIALVIVLLIQFALKAILPKDNIIFDSLRYFLLSFVTLGVYPILTKKYFFQTS